MFVFKMISVIMLSLLILVSVNITEKNEEIMSITEIVFLLFLFIPLLYIILN